MSKIEVKVVIGSNYGDECKGLATHYFCKSAKDRSVPCLNVLYNGGCQRGHTVHMNDGRKHVFHHFGSGSFDNADTYFDRDFMVNPMMFVDEMNELYHFGGIRPICFISPECRVTTPYDMFINQIVEDSRKDKRHGSCGFGIWETKKRYELSNYNLTFSQIANNSDEENIRYLSSIAYDYVKDRLMVYGIDSIPSDYMSLISTDGLLNHYLSDIRYMQASVIQAEFPTLVDSYGCVVFEGAQGLELDEDNSKCMPYITASKTTSLTPVQRVLDIDCDIEVCYVTRSYFTRHGTGILPTECDMQNINPSIQDDTNLFNRYQRNIRYGLFNKEEFLSRVLKDQSDSNSVSCNIKPSVFISHLNYTAGDIAGDCRISDIAKYFHCVYLSDSKYAEDVRGN
ncbi:MAG: adenylosuccinate synthetase [Endomicrobiaceae bacterium]|nr:adenylosuccinate synthetase [Endomicrobiaceae bacterium]